MAEGGGAASPNYINQGTGGRNVEIGIMWEHFWVCFPDKRKHDYKEVINPAAAAFVLRKQSEKVKNVLKMCHLDLHLQEDYNCISLTCKGGDVADFDTFFTWFKGAVAEIEVLSMDITSTSPLTASMMDCFSSIQHVEIKQKAESGMLYLVGRKDEMKEVTEQIQIMMTSFCNDEDDEMMTDIQDVHVVNLNDNLIACLLEELKFEDEMKKNHADCCVLIDKTKLCATFVGTDLSTERCSSEVQSFLGKIKQSAITVDKQTNILLCKKDVREAISEEIRRNGLTRIHWQIPHSPSGNFCANINIFALSKSEVDRVEKIIRESYSKLFITDEFVQDENFKRTLDRLEPYLLYTQSGSSVIILGYATAISELKSEHTKFKEKNKRSSYKGFYSDIEFLHIQKLKFQSYLSKKLPHAMLSVGSYDKSITIFGTIKDIEDFKNLLNEFLGAVHGESINLPEKSILLLCGSNSVKIHMQLEKENVICHWQPRPESKTLLHVYGQNKDMADKAVSFLKNYVQCLTYPASDVTTEAFLDPAVQSMLRRYTGELEIEGLHTPSTTVQVFVFKDRANEVRKCISDVIEKLNAVLQTKEEYIAERKMSFLHEFENQFLQDLQNRNKVEVTVTNNGVQLHGQRAKVHVALKELREKLKAINTDCTNIDKVRAEDLKRDKETLRTLQEENQCLMSIECGSPVQVCTWMSTRNYGLKDFTPKRIVLVHGNAMKVKSDVLVCPVNVNAVHAVGICQSIVFEGGHGIDDGLKQIQELKKSSSMVWNTWKPGKTHQSYSTGKLPCQCLLYVCVPDIDITSDLRSVIDNVIQEADKLQYKSIAIPAELLEDSPKLNKKLDLLRNIAKCLSHKMMFTSCLEEAHLCLQNPDQIKDAEDVLNRELPSDQFLSYKIPLPFIKDGESKISVGIHLGAIAKYRADVIVNTIGIDLDLNIGGVSKGILKEAGEGIQKECNMQCKRASYGKVIVTSSGNIQSCKAIFHGSLPYWTPSGQFSLKVLMSFVYDCLNLASARNYNSIAFPSMGTGKLEYPKREVATAMWDAVEMFSQKNPTSSVKKVTFVLFRSDAKVIPHFETEELCRRNVYKRQPFEDRGLLAETVESWIKAPSMMVHLQVVREPYLRFDCSMAVVKLLYVGIAATSNYTGSQGKISNSLKTRDKDGICEIEGNLINLTEQSYQDVVRSSLKFCCEIQSTVVDIHVLETSGAHSLTFKRQSMLIREEVEKMKANIKVMRLLRIMLPSHQQSFERTIADLSEERSKTGFFSFNDKTEPVWRFRCPMEEMGNVYITGENHAIAKVCDAVQRYKIPQSSQSQTSLGAGISDTRSNSYPQTNPDFRRSGSRNPEPQIDQDPRMNEHGSSQAETNLDPPKMNDTQIEWCLQDMEPMEPLIYRTPPYFSKQLNEALRRNEMKTEILKRNDNDVYNCDLKTMKCKLATSPNITMKIIKKEPLMQIEKDFEDLIEGEDNATENNSGDSYDITKAMAAATQGSEGGKDRDSKTSPGSSNKIEEKDIPCIITDMRILKHRGSKKKWWKYKEPDLVFKDGRLIITYYGRERDRKSLQRKVTKLLQEIVSTSKEEIALDLAGPALIQEIEKEISSSVSNVECFADDGNLVLCSENYEDIQRAKHIAKVKLGKIQTSKVNRRHRCFESGHAAQEEAPPKTPPPDYDNVHRALSNVNISSDDCSDFTTKEGLIVKVYTESILNLRVDAIVNAANENLMHGAGIAAVIAKAAGYELGKEGREYVQKHGSIPVGTSISTTAGNLKYNCVIHTVGPMWNRYNNARDCLYDLEKAVMSAIDEAQKQNLSSLAIPAISSGIFGVPSNLCAETYCKAVISFSNSKWKRGVSSVSEVHFVDKNDTMINLIRSVFQQNLRGLSVSSSNTTLPSSRKTRSLAGTIRQSDGSTIKTSEEDCCICMDKCTIPKRLGCGHIFCKECIDTQFKYKATCPACGAVFGRLYGDQPPGTMTIYTQSASLPGYPDDGTIEIRYNIPAGKQQENHPTPGAYYEAINRPGFLPDNEKGRLVCKLLNVAFSRKQIFTIGRSRTTGKDGVVTWNDIHHKTRREGGPPRFGYPDPSYLDRVTEELQVKGVTEDTLDDPDEYKEYTRVIKY